MNEVTLAGPDDWSAYREIRLAALTDAPQAFASTLDRETALTETEWRQRLQNSATFFGYRDGKLLALAVGLPQPDGTAEIVSVWAHPSARGTGLARATIEAVLNWAADRPSVGLWVAEDNPGAEKLYVTLGFRRTGEQQPLPNDPARLEFRLTR
ncbi:GNAT family N-acetyltransferase [Actinocrispum sp. NPDC049592]|uniref:GNAT family N-acetyltransferase n=1 Tax=Actinocrispum sp. NPDC049592 TaxID=3154835 RepID=UPI0034166179